MFRIIRYVRPAIRNVDAPARSLLNTRRAPCPQETGMGKLVRLVVRGSKRYLDHWLGIQSLQGSPPDVSRKP